MFLTVKEVAEQLRISLSFAYRLIARGEIPSYEIHSCKRVDVGDLEAYLRQQTSGQKKLPRGIGKHF